MTVKPKPVVLPPLKEVPSPNYSTRSAPISLVVLHDTEGAYEGAVSWFSESRSQVSAHIVLKEDGSEATQCVRYAEKAWACVDYNSASINIEMAGEASKGYGSEQLAVAARIVAFFLKKYDLPCEYVVPSSSGAIGKGWTLHQDLGVAGGGHHDPGFSPAQIKTFGEAVTAEYKRGGFRPTWGE